MILIRDPIFILKLYLPTPHASTFLIAALEGLEAIRIIISPDQEVLALHLVLAAVHLDREILEVRLAIQEILEIRSVQGITTTICNRAA